MNATPQFVAYGAPEFAGRVAALLDAALVAAATPTAAAAALVPGAVLILDALAPGAEEVADLCRQRGRRALALRVPALDAPLWRARGVDALFAAWPLAPALRRLAFHLSARGA